MNKLILSNIFYTEIPQTLEDIKSCIHALIYFTTMSKILVIDKEA